MKIIADINIIPAIVVQIGNGNAETVTKAALVNTSLLRDVRKCSLSIEVIIAQ